jgi:hypothetical protein
MLKFNRQELLNELEHRIDGVETEVSGLTEELEDLDSQLEKLHKVYDYLTTHEDINLETEPSFRPTQETTLKELGLENIIRTQKDLSEKFEIAGINVLDLLDW